MQSLAANGYTVDQVKSILHASNRRIAFRYELLDNNNQFKKNLDNVISANVSNDAAAVIKRTARFSLYDDGSVNYLSDRIKPYARLWLTGGWVEWALGVFILSTPPRSTDNIGNIIRSVEAYDLLQTLIDDKVRDRYTINQGTNYIAAVKSLLDSAGLTTQNLTATNKTLPAARDWSPGTTKLQMINDLLTAINYRGLYMDEDGVAIAQPYVSPEFRASEYTYRDDEQSVIFPEMNQGLDLFNVPNCWVLVVSESDRPPLVSTYINENPSSPTSTVNRGRTIVDYRENEEAADQQALDDKAQRLAFEASQIFEEVEFSTAIMPVHSQADVFTLEYTKLGISAKYSETAWSFDLKAGAQMKHQIRRVVSI